MRTTEATPKAPRHTPAETDLRPMLTTEQLACLISFEQRIQEFTTQLDRLLERHAVISSRFHLLIEKLTVVTEVGLYARRTKGLTQNQRMTIFAGVISAIDEPDDFWYGTSSLSIKDWVKRCVDKYRGNKLLDITSDDFKA